MGKGQSTAGLVLGIIGIIFGFLNVFSIIGLPIAIVGLVLSVSGSKKLKAADLPTGVATAALVVGIIAVVLNSITFLTCGICVLCATGIAASTGSLF